MSDTKLRDLERRWQETGAVEDEVAYFTERVRAGDLSEDRIRLATYLGNEAPPTLTGVVEPPGPLQEWLAELRQWSVEALARGVVAATSAIAARTTAMTEATYRCPYENRPIPPLGCDSCLTGPRYGALAAQEWLLNKTEKHRLHLQHQLWFPEFETDAVRQAVRRDLMPWVLGPGPLPVEEHFDPVETTIYSGATLEATCSCGFRVPRIFDADPWPLVACPACRRVEPDLRRGLPTVRSCGLCDAPGAYVSSPVPGTNVHVCPACRTPNLVLEFRGIWDGYIGPA